jgi:CheY-like chemotaxis protein
MRHQNEDLVARLTASLAETAQAQQARSRFLAAASHDLLQPVHALMLLVGVLRDSGSETAREQAARRIELTTGAIASMFRGLLDQARLDAGAVTPRLEPVSIGTVCRGIEAAYAERCREKGLALSVECAPDVLVQADAALLDRALRNLVDNAVKFTEHGSVSLIVTPSPHRVLVQVSDTGVGIDATDRPRVFDAFYRGAGANSMGIEGVGLGLSVTAQMLDLMGARIELESTHGHGTRVQVSLARAGPIPRSAPAHPLPDRSLRFHRILVVEDDRNAREALQMWLVDRGCEVTCVASLAEALAAYAPHAIAPDYILSDLHLADGPDGIQAIGALRLRFGDVPAALITGETIEARAVPIGVGLLHKPVQPAQLENLLQGHRTESEAGA